MSSSATRRLALHASALSDVEYDLYTSSLRDLVLADEDPERRSGSGQEDDVYFETMKIGVREARAWLRGRYSHVSVGVIDKILRLFSPNLGPTDVLSGSEFFAALRLVIHSENGAEVERSLAFVQANPTQNAGQAPANSRVPQSSRTTAETRSIPSTSRTTSPSPRKRSADLPPPPHHPNTGSAPVPPPMPTRRPHTESIVSTKSSKSNPPDSHPSSTHNPFSHPEPTSPSQFRAQPPLHPSQRSETSKSSSAVGASSSSTPQHSAYNPFVQRPPQPRSEDGTSVNKLPPLPPRKPPPPVPLVQPPQHVSTRNRGDRSTSPSKHGHNPLPPPPPPPPAPPTAKLAHHVTSNLIKQSLQASKVAQSMKRAEEQLEKERVMQVLKSSSVVSGSYSLAGASIVRSSVVIGTYVHNQHPSQHQNRGVSAERKIHASSSLSASSGSEGAPPLPQRNKQPQYQYAQYHEDQDSRGYHQQQQPSPPLSASSMEQVALASVPAPASQPKPSRNYTHLANVNPDPFGVSPFRSPIDPASPTGVDLPEHSPSRSSTSHGHGHGHADPPPTHPGRKPYFPYQVLHHPSPMTFPDTRGGDDEDAGRRSFDDIYGTTTPDPSPSKQPRVFRSRSMHQTSPTQVHAQTQALPPPVRRKRPESVQVLRSGEVLMGSLSRGGGGDAIATTPDVGMARPGGMNTPHRRSSLSVSMTPMSNAPSLSGAGAHGPGVVAGGYGESSLSNFQRTIAATLQPKLDKARYKAEAGLSRRGFVRDPHGGEEKEGLMGGEGNESKGRKTVGGSLSKGGWAGTRKVADGVDGDGRGGLFDDPEIDEDWSTGPGMDAMSGNGDDDVFDTVVGPGERGPMEKDNLKWPSGEGWKPL